jgi:hypothetical protein
MQTAFLNGALPLLAKTLVETAKQPPLTSPQSHINVNPKTSFLFLFNFKATVKLIR